MLDYLVQNRTWVDGLWGARLGCRDQSWSWVFLAFSMMALSPFFVYSASASPTSPDFYIAMEAPVASVYQGSSASAVLFVYVYSNAYFSGWVNLTATVTPNFGNALTLYLEKPNIYMIPAVTYDSGVDLGAFPSAPFTSYNVTITAVGGGLTRTANFTATVIPPLPPPDFSVALWPSEASLQPGYAEGVTVAVNRVGPHLIGDLGIVLDLIVYPYRGLEPSGFPGGTTIGYQYDGVSSTFIVASTSTAIERAYTMKVTGTEPARSYSPTGWTPAVTHTANATITVTSSVGFSGGTEKAPLLYELGFSGSHRPGDTITLVNRLILTRAATRRTLQHYPSRQTLRA